MVEDVTGPTRRRPPAAVVVRQTEPSSRDLTRRFRELADVIRALPPSTERTAALLKLIESHEVAVRASLGAQKEG